MERLSQHDLRIFLELLRQLYAPLEFDLFVPQLLSALSQLVPSEWTYYNEVDPCRQKLSAVGPAAGFPDANEIFRQYMPEHPLIDHYGRTADSQALMLSDFLSQRQFHRLGLYHEFYRRLEVEYQMAVTLPVRAPVVIGLTVNRSRPAFSERERLLLNLLRPHLVQAHGNAKVFTQMWKALRELDRGIVTLTSQGRVLLLTEQARQWLEEYFAQSFCQGDRLPEDLQRWVTHQLSFLAQDSEVPPPRVPLVVDRGGKRLIVRLMSERWEDQHLLVLEEEAGCSPRSLELLGLTRREVEVLFWVIQGKTNKEIATILGRSFRTVRVHLEHVFQQLGVETRTAAAKQALETLGLLKR